MKTLILGVGNFLLKDEGVGIHVIRELEKESLPPDISLMDGGTGGLHLLSWLQDYDRIIMIDATLDDNPPGTIRLIRPCYASDFPPLMSAHEIGLRDMIEAMSLLGNLPVILLIVISAAKINEIGTGLSPEVQAVLPDIIQLVKDSVLEPCHCGLDTQSYEAICHCGLDPQSHEAICHCGLDTQSHELSGDPASSAG